MIARAFRAMGTQWWIAADASDLLPDAEALVHAIEARLTRFRTDSALARLNRERRSDDPLLRAVLARALELRDRTGGAFDPMMGRDLAELGYDRPFEAIAPRAPRPPLGGERRVHLSAASVSMEGNFDVDLGGIAKGWAVDRVHDWLLAAGAAEVLVDGGGDLRGSGREWPIGVEGGGAVSLDGDAVATSSTRERRWSAGGRVCHHILDPRTRAPSASGVDLAVVRAPTADVADALATALIADPAGVLPRLPDFGAEALVAGGGGQLWITDGWEAAV